MSVTTPFAREFAQIYKELREFQVKPKKRKKRRKAHKKSRFEGL